MELGPEELGKHVCDAYGQLPEQEGHAMTLQNA